MNGILGYWSPDESQELCGKKYKKIILKTMKEWIMPNEEVDSNIILDQEKENKKSPYEELKIQIEKEIPDYEKFLPQYELVNEIPEVEQRKKGVKYINSEEIIEQIKINDLKRILKGERETITNTPVVQYSEDELKQKIIKELKEDKEFLENIPAEFQGGDIIDDYIKMEADNYLIQFCGGGKRAIFDDNDKEIMFLPNKNVDLETYAHEDTHAYLDKYNKNDDLYKRGDFVAVNEGLAHAIEELYTEENDDSVLYIGKTDPNDVLKSKKLIKQLILIVGPDKTKKFVADVFCEAFNKETNAVDLLEKRIKEFINT